MIKVTNINKKYKNKRGNFSAALKDVSLEFNSTGLVFIVGKTGCGKSTLLKVLSGLVKPDSGTVFFDNKEVTALQRRESEQYLANDIAIVFQEHNLLEDYTVYQNIALSNNISGTVVSKDQIDARLQDLGLLDSKEKMIYQLSGGEKQRIAIARALIKDPKAILLDEPTGSLDKDNTETIFKTLKEISRDKLVIVVSHDLDSATKYADRIVRMDKGEVIKDEVINQASKNDATANSVNKQGHLPIKDAANLGWGMFKRKSTRLWVLTGLSALSMLFLAVALLLAMYNEQDYVKRFIKKTDLQYAVIQKKEDLDSNVFSSAEITALDKKIQSSKIWVANDAYIANNSIQVDSEESNNFSFNFRGYFNLNESNINLKDFGLSILAGNMPANNQEIMITSYIYEGYLKHGFYDTKDIKHNINDANDVVGKEIKILEETVTISGIVQIDFSYDRYNKKDLPFDVKEILRIEYYAVNDPFACYIFVNEDFASELGKSEEAASLVLSLNSKAAKKEVVNLLYETKNDLELGGVIGKYTWNHEYQFRNVIPHYSTIVAITIGLVILIAFLVSTESLTLRTKEINILRSLGMKKGDMFKIFLSENLISSAVMIASSIILSLIVIGIYNYDIEKNDWRILSNYHLDVKMMAVMTGVYLLAGIVFVMVLFNIKYNNQKKLSNQK